MTTIAKRIDEVIQLGLARELQAEGYRKKGRFFREASLEGIRVIQVQASRDNHGGTGKFTINIGVYFAEIRALLSGRPHVPEPTDQDVAVGVRVPYLIHGQDRWWSISDNTDLAVLATEVARAHVSLARPWLAQRSTLEGFLEAPDRGFLHRAAAAMALGDRDRARTLLSKELPDPDVHPEIHQHVSSYFERWGLR
jgi:hypothetical protein